MRNSHLLLVFFLLVGLSCGVPTAQTEAEPATSQANTLANAARDGDVEALDQLRTLAEGGAADAQVRLASIYANNAELRDYTESAKWYLAAALQGNAVAQVSIGGAYADGRGVEQDLENAEFWLRIAADQGHWLGSGLLGDLHRGSHPSRPGDFVQAYRWYTVGAMILAEIGREDILEGMLMRRSRIAERMTPEEIAEAEELAAGWVRKEWSELESRLGELG